MFVNLKEKINNRLFIKAGLLLTAIAAILVFCFLFQNRNQDGSRIPASYTLYTSEVESRSTKMMEESRRLHIIEDYKSANKTLDKLLNKYPYTGYMEEASFLLAKGLFYEGEYNRSAQVIQRLRDHNPLSRSQWLGYSFLIMGKIHEQRGETDDAIQLYRKVITEFSDEDLVDEAEDILLQVSFDFELY